MMRILASVVALLALHSVTWAQPKKEPQAPPDKIRGRPVQPETRGPAAPGGPTGQPPVVLSSWTKFCGKDSNNPDAKEVCLTVREARLETGQFLAGAALIEQRGDEKKLFRITLPLGMQLALGARILLDKEEPINGRYVTCLPNGCIADFDVSADFVGKLKRGQQIALHGINLPGQVASYLLPLGGFAQANEGPPTDPATFQRDQPQRGVSPPARPK